MEEAQAQHIALDKDEAREIIYGMPYDDWKAAHQTEASDAQKAAFANSHKDQT